MYKLFCIFNKKTQSYLWGKSAGWQIPSSDIEEIKTTNLDAYLKRKGITSIEKLLGPDYSRTQSITVATELALSSENIKNFI